MKRYTHRFALAAITVGGVGFCPFAPGTAGSLAACLALMPFLKPPFPAETVLYIFLVLCCLSVPLIDLVLKEPPTSRKVQKKAADPSYVVLDEVVGQLLAVLLVAKFQPLTWKSLWLSFWAFRLFDILKPWPIGWVEKRCAKDPAWQAIGIVIDDLLAGFVAGLLVIGLLFLKPRILPLLGG